MNIFQTKTPFNSTKEGRAQRWTVATATTVTNVTEAMRRLSLKTRAQRWTVATATTVTNVTEAMPSLSAFEKKRLSTNKKAFTLIELSIVLVIIGLIIGGVLTGQQIMQNARITNAVNGIQAFQAQFQTYAQNFGSLPGDDPSATTRFPTVTGLTDGDNDAQVGTSTSYNSTATEGAASESRAVWEHLRAAGLIKNQVTGGQPANPFGGIYGFQDGAFNGVFTTTTICLSDVPAGAAQAIDAKLDDGSSNSGMIQGAVTSDVNGTPVTAFGNDNNYVICARM